MRDKLIRYLILGVLVFGVFAGVRNQGSQASAAEQGEFSAAAVVILSENPLGFYSLPEPPGFPPVACVGASASVDIKASGSLTVTSEIDGYDADLKVTEAVFQKLPDGHYEYVAIGKTYNSWVAPTLPASVPVDTSFDDLPVGPDYLLGYSISWLESGTDYLFGRVIVAYSTYHRTYDGKDLGNASMCGSLRPPFGYLNTSAGTVNSTASFAIGYFPNKLIPILWDGKQIGSVYYPLSPGAPGTFVVPAAPMGPHTVEWKYGHWSAKATYTVKPRIKLIPSTVARGQTVNFSLRGFAKYETVRIRWKKGTSWVQIGQVKTSGTGSANVYLKVPTWAPNGPASVRGDSVNALGGHAQTNAVTVSGGAPLTSSAVKTATPTATPTPTATATPIPSATPELPEASPTAVPTESATPVAETPAPSETAAPESSPTATAEPTETPSPTEEPVAPDPTAQPSPTP